jgi:hypothetical protein
MSGGLRIAPEDEPECEWQPAMLNNRKVAVCSLEEKLLGSQTYRRIAACRYKVKGQLTIDGTNGYRYYGRCYQRYSRCPVLY